jgi:ubiquinone/menaquinone biosynthesis C-methylase UbiE
MLSMLARENLVAGDLQRRPEEHLVMDAPEQAEAWHAQGADEGPILPVYHLNALACSRLTPFGATVVDLGCGSGRFASYLARQRPDLRIVGLDLSAPMVDMGNAALREAGLKDRVELRQGDMTAFAAELPAETGLINCLFAVHHLPGLEHVEKCLAEMRDASERTGCGFWILDLARPRHASTAVDYPRVFTPDAPQVFRTDSTNSLVAAYSHAELAGAVKRAFPSAAVRSARSRILPLYQAFWRAGRKLRDSGTPPARRSTAAGAALPAGTRSQYLALRAILSDFPR